MFGGKSQKSWDLGYGIPEKSYSKAASDFNAQECVVDRPVWAIFLKPVQTPGVFFYKTSERANVRLKMTPFYSKFLLRP